MPLVLGAFAYAWLYHRAERERGGWPAWRAISFAAGMTALAGGLALSDATLAAHMAGHALMVTVAAPLIVLGRPVTLALRALPAAEARRLALIVRSRPVRIASHPLVAWSAFVGAQLAFHITPLFDLA